MTPSAGDGTCSHEAGQWRLYRDAQRWGFLAVLFLVTTSNYFDYFVLSVVLEPIKREFNVSDTSLGLLSGFGFALVYALAGLPVARWADRGNRPKIISYALAGWSVMTALCGWAQSFLQLAVARLGVGALEPGALPSAQSLVVDYFPPERRSTALAFLTMGASGMGYLLAVALGGYVTATLGWRYTFIMAGVPGIALAIIVRTSLSEPRNTAGYARTIATRGEPISQTLRQLARKPSFVLLLAAQSVATIFATAASLFFPSYMIRSLHATLGQVSGSWGFAVAFVDVAGGLLGGWLADRLSQRDVRWYAWVSGMTTALAIPFYLMALLAHHLWSFIALDSIGELAFSMAFPPVFAALHAVCGSRRRAMAVAVIQLCFYLVGMGIGPTLAGIVSDAFAEAHGAESLRYSLIAMLIFLVPAACIFLAAAQAMHKDLED